MLDSAAKEQMEQTLYRKSSSRSLAEGLLKDSGGKKDTAGPGPRGLVGYNSEKLRNGFACDLSHDRVPSGKLRIIRYGWQDTGYTRELGPLTRYDILSLLLRQRPSPALRANSGGMTRWRTGCRGSPLGRRTRSKATRPSPPQTGRSHPCDQRLPLQLRFPPRSSLLWISSEVRQTKKNSDTELLQRGTDN